MKRTNFTMNSHDKITTLHGCIWKPEKEVRGIVQLVHGMVEYIERYDGFAAYLAERGILVVGHDHLGHGESVTSKENWGYFEENNGNRVLLDDIHQVRLAISSQYPDVPYVIAGHSMGSFLTRQYICEHGEGLAAAVIIGTGDMPKELLRFAMFLCSVMAGSKGFRYRSPLITKIAFGSYNKRIKPVRTPNDWLTKDEAVVDEYNANPKNTFMFTLNGYYNLFYSMFCLKDKKTVERMPRELPVLLTAGEEDPVGGYGAGVRAVYGEFVKLGMSDVSLKLYPGDRHEILNELDKEQVYADLYQWIDSRMG